MPWGLAAGYPAKRLCLRWPSLIGAVDPFFALGGDPRRHGMVEFEAHPASVPVARQQSLVAVAGCPLGGGVGPGRDDRRRLLRRLHEPDAGWCPTRLKGTFHQCWINTYDCGDFSTRSEAQAVYMACGGRQNDVHRLDRNRDGWACEALP